MGHVAIPADTSAAARDVQVVVWRRLTVADRVELVDLLSNEVGRLAVVGIRSHRPELDDAEVAHELSRRRFGTALADAAHLASMP